jgi:LAGLIDADG endonuclease
VTDRKAFGHWLSGFCDGEACFHLKSCDRKGQLTRRYACSFQLGLRADDLPILQEIKRYFGYGSIRPFRTKSKHPLNFRSKPRFYFYIDGVQANLKAVISHFDSYPLRSRKARDYVVYREAVIFMAEVGRRPRNIRVPGGARRWSKEAERTFLALKRRLEDGRIFKLSASEMKAAS